MRITGFRWLIILFVCFGLLIEGTVFADESNNIDLSYKMIESNSDDQAIRMLVKLKAKNNTSYPLFNVKAHVDSIKNVNINANEISLGDINVGETIISSDSFTVAINVSSSEQESPQIEVVWVIEYMDVSGNRFVEEISLQ